MDTNTYWSWWRIVPLMVALMSGILSLVRELTVIYGGHAVPERPLFWRCVWIAFIISSVTMWILEHKALTDAQTKIAALEDQSTPKLALTIDEFGVGEMQHEGETTKTPGVLIIANLTNKGAPSIAESWSLAVTLTDGRSAETGTSYINPKYPINRFADSAGAGNAFSLSGADALYQKTSSKPIERGEKVRGILIFTFKEFPIADLRQTGNKFQLKCKDVDGKVVEKDYTFVNKNEAPQYFPGLEPIPEQKR